MESPQFFVGLPSENGGKSGVGRNYAAVLITVGFADYRGAFDILIEPLNGSEVARKIAFVFIVAVLAYPCLKICGAVEALVVFLLHVFLAALIQCDVSIVCGNHHEDYHDESGYERRRGEVSLFRNEPDKSHGRVAHCN